VCLVEVAARPCNEGRPNRWCRLCDAFKGLVPSARSSRRLQCRKDWTRSFFIRRMSCLRSCVAVLSNRLLSGVHKRCQSWRSYLFPASFCLMMIGQPWILAVAGSVGVACQPAY
jgi:hypothetical protein